MIDAYINSFEKETLETRHKECIFLIHGLGDSSASFNLIIPNLNIANVDVINIDLPGFGSKAEFLLDFNECIDALGIIVNRYGGHVNHFIGHSLGGLIVLLLLGKYPLLKTGLVFTIEPSITSVDYDYFRSIQEEPIGIGLEGLIKQTKSSDYQYANNYKISLKKSNEKVFKDFTYNVFNNFLKYVNIIKDSATPFIYFIGEESTCFTERIEESGFNRKIIRIPDSQHWIQIDNPSALLYHIMYQLRKS